MESGKKVDPMENLPQGTGTARDLAGKALGVKKILCKTRLIG
jgi:hypothetical protein